MLAQNWKILHKEDIPNITKGSNLYLTWQDAYRGPFCSDVGPYKYRADFLNLLLERVKPYGGLVLWMYVEAPPAPPQKHQVLCPFKCTKPKGCEFEDDGYCMNGPDDCGFKTPYPEIYVTE